MAERSAEAGVSVANDNEGTLASERSIGKTGRSVGSRGRPAGATGDTLARRMGVWAEQSVFRPSTGQKLSVESMASMRRDRSPGSNQGLDARGFEERSVLSFYPQAVKLGVCMEHRMGTGCSKNVFV